ncbi:MAG: zinc-ribbon domain-containing protein, partial [Clostridia bacterium]
MSFCNKCGKEMPKGAKFCQSCGANNSEWSGSDL